MLDGVSMGEFNASMGNAKRAATYKKASPLQQAMLTYPKELEKELETMEPSNMNRMIASSH